MAKMAQYCKAYYVKDLRKFAGWSERLEELRVEKEWKDGQEHEIVRTALADDDVLYLQPGLQVTDGIFEDEHIVFKTSSGEWATFCKEVLKFELPDYAKSVGTDVSAKAADDSQSANA
jgi:hypothetical protein